MIPDAVIRNLEIVGEAGGKLSEDANEKMPEVPWRRAVGLTNVLIHGYQDVDIETVWRVVDEALQPLLVAFKETPIVRTSDTRSDDDQRAHDSPAQATPTFPHSHENP